MRLHQKLFWLLVFLLPVQLGRHLWPEWSYVLGLRVDYLSPTIYLTDLLVGGILVTWGREELKTQNSKLKTTTKNLKFFCLPFAIFCFLLMNSFLAQNPGAALYKFVKIVEFSLLGLYIAKNQYPVSSIQHPVSLAVIYSFLIALAQFIKQASIGGIFWWLGERTFTVATPGIARAVIDGRLLMRPYATFPHPNVLAGFLLVSLIVIASFSSPEKRSRIGLGSNLARSGIGMRWLAIVLGTVAIAISFSRSAWLVGVLAGLWVVGSKLLGKKRRILKVALLILSLIFISTLFYFASRLSTEEAIYQRLYLIKVATLMVQSSPLSGIGLNNFIVRLPDFWTTQTIYRLQPVHNVFLLIAAETGLVGLVIFLWFLILTYKRLLVTDHRLLITTLSVILALGLFDHYWFSLQQSQLLFTIVLGLSWKQ